MSLGYRAKDESHAALHAWSESGLVHCIVPLISSQEDCQNFGV